MDAGGRLLGTCGKVGDVHRRWAELGAASARLGATWSWPEKTPKACRPEEADRTAGATPGEIGGMAVLLELVRSSGDIQEQVLLTGAAVWVRTLPEKEGQRRG